MILFGAQVANSYKHVFPRDGREGRDIAIAGFHCHTIIKTIQQIKSRIKEVKEDEHSTVSQRFRSVRFFVREIFEEMCHSNL